MVTNLVSGQALASSAAMAMASRAMASESAGIPHNIYQVGAGVEFSQLSGPSGEDDSSVLERLAWDGFDGLLLPPLHPASTQPFRHPVTGEEKWGSAYAPKSPTLIAPYHHNCVRTPEYLRGSTITAYEPSVGWTAFREFVRDAKAHGIQPIFDLVLGHVDRSSETVARYVQRFTPEVFMHDPKTEDGIAISYGFGSRGLQDQWIDVAPFSFKARREVRERLLHHHVDEVVMAAVRAGISTFRLDAAWRLLDGDYLGDLISRSRARAKAEGYPRLSFIAETLGAWAGADIKALGQGADAVFDSSHWSDWGPEASWYASLHNAVKAAGGVSVSFPANADTRVLSGHREFQAKTALAALLTPSYTVIEGAHRFWRPSVFLSQVVENRELYPAGPATDPTRAFYRMLHEVKREPIFSGQHELAMTTQDSLTYITKRTEEQEAVIVVQRRDDDREWVSFDVPLKGADILYANNRVFDRITPDKGAPENFMLGPLGIAVFWRSVQAPEGPQQLAESSPEVEPSSQATAS